MPTSSEVGRARTPDPDGARTALSRKGRRATGSPLPSRTRTRPTGGCPLHRKSIATLLSLLLAFALVAAACGDDDNGSAATRTPTTTKKAHRIVSLSATATEMLYAINAGDQVVAVDDQSNYPAKAPR